MNHLIEIFYNWSFQVLLLSMILFVGIAFSNRINGSSRIKFNIFKWLYIGLPILPLIFYWISQVEWQMTTVMQNSEKSIQFIPTCHEETSRK